MQHDKSAQSTVRRTAPKPLTVKTIEAMKAGKMLADGSIRPGSGSLKARKRATAAGSVIEWLFEFRRDGKTARLTIGRFSSSPAEGCLTLDQARDHARALQDVVKRGDDPAAVRELDRHKTKVDRAAAVTAQRESQEKTLKALLDAYVASLLAKGKAGSAKDAKNMFGNHVELAFPELATLPATAILPEHGTRILKRLVGPEVPENEKKGATARKLYANMHAAFNLGLGATYDPMAPASANGFGLTSNPMMFVKLTSISAKFNRAGDRVLSVDELRHYMQHVDALPSTLTRLGLRLQITTAGQRIQQLLRLTLDDVARGSVTIYDPKGKRQEARKHVLPNIPEIAEVLGELQGLRAAGEPGESRLLFATDGTPMAAETLSAAVYDICTAMLDAKQAEKPFRGGDIRRTVETMLSEKLRVDKDTRAQLLSHGLSGVQDRHYDRGEHLEAKAVALRKWNDFLADLCIGQLDEAGGNVKALRRTA